MPLVPPADIQLAARSMDDLRGGLRRICGQMEAGSKVIGAAMGDIAQQRPALQSHEPGDHLIERAVAAHRHHRVKISPVSGGCFGRIIRRGGVVDGEQIACLREGRHRVVQRPPGLAAPSRGIDDHEKGFRVHKMPPAYQSGPESRKDSHASIARRPWDCNSFPGRVK